MAIKSSKLIDGELRKLPGVDTLLENPRLKELACRWSQPLVVSTIRAILTEKRAEIRKGKSFGGADVIVREIIDDLNLFTAGFLRKVINATGIIIHTNLGRSPISPDIISDVLEISAAYSNLEFDLISGKRGKRGSALRQLISIATGCESALVVNNNAAALFLILADLAGGSEVIVSRGELVQIGGGFKIPEIMGASGAIMKEVGTTNRTSIKDYDKAISSKSALMLKVHRSNFIIEGFFEEVSFSDLAELGRRRKMPVVIDLGSGVLVNPSISGLDKEPTIREAVKSGADLICFSGDKLLGGGQAGIIIGKRKLIERLNKNPIFREVRPDKITIGILESLFMKYLKGEIQEIPIWASITVDDNTLLDRSRRFVEKLNFYEGRISIENSFAYAGGGSDPGGKIKSVVIAFHKINAQELSAVFRKCNPPVIGRIEGGLFCLDLRTVFPSQEEALSIIVKEALINYK